MGRAEPGDFMVAGTQFEGRAEVIERHADPGDRVYLVRDRGNRFSRNAVEVRLKNGLQIGFVPEEDAVEVAPLLDEGHLQEAIIKKILTGGRRPSPVVVAALFPPHVSRDGLVRPDQVPTRSGSRTASPQPAAGPTSTAAQRSGCGVVLLAAGLLVSVAVVLAGLVS